MKSGYDDYGGYDYDYNQGPSTQEKVVSVAKKVAITTGVLAAVGAGFFYGGNIINGVSEMLSPKPALATETATPVPKKTEQPHQKATPTPAHTQTREATPQPTPTEANKTVRSEFVGGVRINYDKDDHLVSYEVNGVETTISQEQINNAKSEAEKNGVGLLTVVDIYNEEQPKSEKPLVAEAPDDILTNDELAKRGITIENNDDVELQIRKGAFEPGALFEQYQPDGDKKLNIVLVEGPRVPNNGGSFDYEQIRQEAIDLEESQIRLFQTDLGNSDPIMRQIAEEQIAMALARIQQYQKASNDRLVLMTNPSAACGLYDPVENIIYVATGADEPLPNKQVIIYINSEGETRVMENSNLFGHGYLAPSRNDSYPNPSDFRWNGNGPPPTEWPDLGEGEADNANYNKYPFAAQTLPQITRHEATHSFNAQGERTSVDIDWKNEYKTDMEAMGTIGEAYRRWEKNGDDSGYYFYFVNKKTGEKILGQNQNLANQEV